MTIKNKILTINKTLKNEEKKLNGIKKYIKSGAYCSLANKILQLK